jgi:hypothetical protein
MPKDSNQNPVTLCPIKQVIEPTYYHEPEINGINTNGIKGRFQTSNYMIVTTVTSIRLALEYPFWSIRVNMQSNPIENTSMFTSAKNIYKSGGFKGFYAGATPYFLGSLCKQAYRLPAISLLPGYFKSWVPESWENNYGLPHIAAASSLALAETTVFGPIERLVRYKMVHNKLSKISIRFLYTGTGVNLAQNMLCWNLFSMLENFGQTQAKHLLKKEDLSITETFGVGLFVGVSMTLVTQPVDALQTFAQTRPVTNDQPLFTAYKNHIKQHGLLKSCFAGTKAALIQGVIGASATVFALEAFRNRTKPLLIEGIDNNLDSQTRFSDNKRPSLP